MGETRKLAAILVADVVGYSRLAAADEDRTLVRLRGLLVISLIPPSRSIMAVSSSALVTASLSSFAAWLTPSLRHRGAERHGRAQRWLAHEGRIEFRIGIHLGDVVEELDGDLMGEGVNIAPRLEGIAKPNAICLSEQAYWQVKGRLDLAVRDLGPTHLKNIAEPIRVYSLDVGQPAQPNPGIASAPQKSAPPRLSMVVLPSPISAASRNSSISSTASRRA